MFISIIIPVFNVEKYVSNCIESLLYCKREDIELILVNDGSTDRSVEICENYSKTYNNIKLVTQKNEGLSKARNTGIAHSRGQFLMFVDSDDFVVPEQFNRFVEFLKNRSNLSDVIVNDFFRVTADGIVFKETKQIETEHGKDYLLNFINSKGCYWNVWRAVYKKAFLEEKQIEFMNGLLCEDIDFFNKVILSDPLLNFVHIPYYCYRMERFGSIMGTVSYRRVESIVNIINQLREGFGPSIHKDVEQAIRHKLALEYFLTLACIHELRGNEKVKATVLLRDSKGILDDLSGGLISIKYFVSLLRISQISFFLYMLKRIRRKFRIWRINVKSILRY